jgi:hypothetical protein
VIRENRRRALLRRRFSFEKGLPVGTQRLQSAIAAVIFLGGQVAPTSALMLDDGVAARSVAAATAAPGEAAAEPDAESCQAAVARARAVVDSLPTDDLSRRAAESDLVQARVEAGNGEFDDCLELAARATTTAREHRYRLMPGESADVHRGP